MVLWRLVWKKKHSLLGVNFEYCMLAIFFIGIFFLNYFTPIHSDDYSYKLRGLGLENHWELYRGWSGRVLADYIASAILLVENKVVIAAIQTAGLFSVIYFINSAPYFFKANINSDVANKRHTFLLLLVIAFVSMPVFGQVALWVGGSANYLWTAVFYSSFLYFVSKYVATGVLPVAAYPVALLSGCTNESVFPAVAFFLMAAIVYRYYVHSLFDKKLIFLMVLFLVGAAVLIASPGNQKRLLDPAFSLWRSMPIVDKIELHLSKRFFYAFEFSSIAYVMSIAFIAIGFVKNKKSIFVGMAALFFIMSMLSNAAMVMAPFVPQRSLMPLLVFILFSISYSLIFLQSFFWRLIKKITVALSLYALFVLLLVLSVFSSLPIQERMRDEVISHGANGLVEIPDFYFRWMPSNDRYRIDAFSNPLSMEKYFGVDKIVIDKAGFDYSMINRELATNGAWSYREVPLYKTTFIAGAYKLDSDIYAVEIKVDDVFGGSDTYYISKREEISGKAYIYGSIVFPKMLIKSYSTKQLSLTAYFQAVGLVLASSSGDNEVYLSNKEIVYVNKSCTNADDRNKFFVKTFAVADKKYSDYFDYTFKDGDYKKGALCILQRDIDISYPIKGIEAGQFDAKGILWSISKSW
jgi:hypothetical protein